MSERYCAICKRTNSLFSLEFNDDDGEEWRSFVCGTCWEHIAEIAQRALKSQIDALTARIEKLEIGQPVVTTELKTRPNKSLHRTC